MKKILKWQRICDVFLASICLILLSPIYLIVALCIKLEDPKLPIFYIQERIGVDGKPFNMYKFRSMRAHADEWKVDERYNLGDDKLFKMKDDPRVTRVGKWIRSTSLDELPQMINVLKGDMSLVGPRPSLPHEVEHYQKEDLIRLQVVPGCTGPWQVSKVRNYHFHVMLEQDKQWIEHRNLLLYFKLILKTIWLMIYSGYCLLRYHHWQ